MLPNSTSRYGDLLREFYEGIKNNTLSQNRLDEIVRVFNEFSQREDLYKSWLLPEGGIKVSKAVFKDLVDPLDAFALDFDTDATISDATKTFLSFDSAARLSEAFSLNSADKSKIMVTYSGTNIMMGGITTWAQNATGYRIFGVEGFDSNDVSLGSQQLYSMQGHNSADNIFPFYWILDGIVIQNISYLKFWVQQNRGGTLNFKQADVILAKI